MKLKLIITGYYDKQNYGDDLFKEVAKKLFKSYDKFSTKIVPINNLLSNNDIFKYLFIFSLVVIGILIYNRNIERNFRPA